MEKQKKEPELRFPKFTGEWEKNTLGAIFKISAGGDIDIKNSSQKKDEIFKYPIYANAEKDKGLYGYSDVYKVEENVITVAGRGINIGIAHARDHKFYPIVRLLVLKPKNLENIYFFEYQINRLNLFKESTGVPQLTAPQVSSYEILFPQIFEQQKIASFLTAVDDKLNQLKKKKSLLEQYKKGVIQKIFSQELRFKDEDGKEFPEWEMKKFGEVYSFKTTNSFSRENLNYEIGEVKNIHYGDIHTKFKLQFDITKESVPFINPEISICRIAEDTYCKEGDLIIADASEDYADVGKSIELVKLNQEKTVAGLHTILARPNLSMISIGFGGFLMKSFSVRNQVMTIAQGTKVLSISASRLAGIEIGIPLRKEQTKIAYFLSAIDEKINNCNAQIEKTEQWKKGLLQKMFV